MTSRAKLAEKCRLGEQPTRDALENLRKIQAITTQGTKTYTLVTITNYDTYQPLLTAQEPAEEPSEEPAEDPTKNQQETQQRTTTKELKNIRTQETNTPLPPAGAGDVLEFSDGASLDSQSMVRPAVPTNGNGKRRRKANRTLDEVRRDLGIRLEWFNKLCEVHPAGKLGVKAGATAFERRVTPDEAGHQLARAMYRGAVTYAAEVQADPTMKVKWLQGWINDERWTDQRPVVQTREDQRTNEWLKTCDRQKVM